ncbi:MAG: PAS domain-containing protein, partial [Chloroflexi bacterium]|nr:PAS domain-containing protein [Chloroflexota bacterium]
TSAINNAELYRLIRDQAERLGGMLRANQVEASKSQSILESVADGVLVTDPEGKVILFNATAERILQLSRDEVLGRPANDFLGFYGARAKNLTAAIRRWSEDPTSYQLGDLLAERIELEDNRIISVLLTPVTSSDEFLGSVSIFRDITREVEVDRIKTEFVTTASHELLTPITPIKGYADLLLMGATGTLTPKQQEVVELIKSNADRLRSLVDDLLDISRIESGKIDLQLAPVPIQEVINEVVTHLQERVNTQKPMHIVSHIADDLPLVSADRERLIQIITNLADNAFSYTEGGGTITFEAHLEDGDLVVSVGDTGIGLSPEDKARMFERFYRAENPLVMASAGTGLGLSIVQRLVDMHEGKLWAESDGIGCGSTFYVQLKLAAKTSEVLETSEV